MPKAAEEVGTGSDDDEGIDPGLAARFNDLMGDRSVAKLRKDMAQAGYSIGANAIQLAKKGSLGLRLGTAQKFAHFFGMSLSDLLRDESIERQKISNAQAALSALTDTQRRALLASILGNAASDETVEQRMKITTELKKKDRPQGPDSGFSDL